MAESILNSTKPFCNVFPEDPTFDSVLITGINTAFMYLHQLGIGPAAGFRITDSTDTWDDFLGTGTAAQTDIEAAKIYVGYKTRMLFDPPTNTTMLETIKEALKEAEWRLITQVENIR